MLGLKKDKAGPSHVKQRCGFLGKVHDSAGIDLHCAVHPRLGMRDLGECGGREPFRSSGCGSELAFLLPSHSIDQDHNHVHTRCSSTLPPDMADPAVEPGAPAHATPGDKPMSKDVASIHDSLPRQVTTMTSRTDELLLRLNK